MTEIFRKPDAIRVTSISQMVKGARWRVEAMRSYSTDVFIWFTRGQGRITISGITRGYNSHSAIFIPAGVMHGFDVSANVSGSVSFFPNGMISNDNIGSQHFRINNIDVQKELTGILDHLQREISNSHPESQSAAQLYAGLLSVWIKRQMIEHADPEEKPNAAQRLCTKFTELVESEYQSGKNISQYAAELGVTPTHLSRVCKQTCGRPASSLLSDRVIFEARRLLRETKTPINKVADQLGYTSPAYFTRSFQHHTGQTPSHFRRAP